MSTPTQTLAEKQKVLDGLAATIELNNRALTQRESEQVEALKYGMGVRLDLLVETCKHGEMDIKIQTMKEVLEVIKAKHD